MYKCDFCGRESFKKIRYGGHTVCSKHMHQLHKYGKVLDKCECIYFSGGASRLFKSCEINGINIIVPLRNNEYLNCIGQFLFGVDQVNKAKE